MLSFQNDVAFDFGGDAPKEEKEPELDLLKDFLDVDKPVSVTTCYNCFVKMLKFTYTQTSVK